MSPLDGKICVYLIGGQRCDDDGEGKGGIG